MRMTVKTILTHKGNEVVTIGPAATLCDAIKVLDLHRIGAVVITDAEKRILGILSERDIVRTLAHDVRVAGGCQLCDQPVETVMTREVATCKQSDTVYEHGADDDWEVPTRSGDRQWQARRNGFHRRCR
jgi:CBS domain-containing protein